MFSAFSIHFQQVNVLIFFTVNFLLRLEILASKSGFVVKFACANLALKTAVAKL